MTIQHYEPGLREVRVEDVPVDGILKAIADIQADLDSRLAKRLGKWFRKTLKRGDR